MENAETSPVEMNDSNAYYRISKKASLYLSETGRWSKFIAILGFCLIVIVVLMGFFSSAILSLLNLGEPQVPIQGLFLVSFYMVFGIIYGVPIWYLFKFSVYIKKSIQKNDMLVFENALKYLKSHYKYIGILSIIILVLYLVMGIGILFVSIMSV